MLIVVNVLSIVWLGFVVYDIKNNYTWNRAYDKVKLGQFHKIENTYKKLSENMRGDVNFIFNYSVVLFRAGRYNESLSYAQKCLSIVNNYDVQLLLADNYYKLKNNDLAIQHYKIASLMCPNRFSPLYGIFIVHYTANDTIQARTYGHTILTKPIKIESKILHELLFDVQEKIDSLEVRNEKYSYTKRNIYFHYSSYIY